MKYNKRIMDIGDEVFCEENGSWGVVWDIINNEDVDIYFQRGELERQILRAPVGALSYEYGHYVLSIEKQDVSKVLEFGKDDADDDSKYGHDCNRKRYWDQYTTFLEDTHQYYMVLEEGESLAFEETLNCKLKKAKVTITFSDFGYDIIAFSDCYIEEDTSRDLLEFLLRANNREYMTHFEVSDDDEIIAVSHYTSWYPSLTTTQMRMSLLYVARILEYYGNGILALSLNLSNVEDELEKAEIMSDEYEERNNNLYNEITSNNISDIEEDIPF